MNKFIATITICLVHFLSVKAQQVDLLTSLSADIHETSGLLFLNQRIITHNDSGGEPALYEIDSVSGNVIRKVILENASNVDWEDVTADDDYIYIGDFGNNAGSRTNLKVYRLSQNDFFNTPNDTVIVDTINFSYADQVDFTPTTYSTNFDAEALIAFNDSLYIFTKNWGNNKTHIYSIPKTPGTYQVERIDSIDTQGLVTGAENVSMNNSVILCGYAGLDPFVFEIKSIAGNQFSIGISTRNTLILPSGYSPQIEGITKINETQFYVSSEEFINGAPPGLFKLTMNSNVGINEVSQPVLNIYPIPASKGINIELAAKESLVILNVLGEAVGSYKLAEGMNYVGLNQIEPGMYILKFMGSGHQRKITVQE
jgi:hypothetical protein